ncbi:single-pass membrane and coiled-coil domain-containing protein 4 isoform X1 [Phascolarctos cinereus]|uniref:Single-pass membrane and coiled-coil domain-containing protein 4 n=1 Tax=Phascolarctos cinereus TaxID=38626 RepID=A0A6P5LKP4_PHACI|nr:single-pass membrane and coiled-coil domain-containing protein 4 isoform X2 [Phascolarctos cinereus]
MSSEKHFCQNEQYSLIKYSILHGHQVFTQKASSLKQEEDTILDTQFWESFPRVFLIRMRQLKGKPKKETSKDKKERKQAMQEARQQITTVVLPTLAVVVVLIVVFVYVATRPATTE